MTSGYCGGDETDPTYEAVKSQTTGHRETVRIVYDDALISFDRLLAIFLDNVDPFDGGGQFIDRGRPTRWRSITPTRRRKRRPAGPWTPWRRAPAGRPASPSSPISAFTPPKSSIRTIS